MELINIDNSKDLATHGKEKKWGCCQYGLKRGTVIVVFKM